MPVVPDEKMSTAIFVFPCPSLSWNSLKGGNDEAPSMRLLSEESSFSVFGRSMTTIRERGNPISAAAFSDTGSNS